MSQLWDSVFITCKRHESGYRILQYTNNLEDENRLFVPDIDAWLDNNYDGVKFWYNFDYPNGTTHTILGTWDRKTRMFIDIDTDEILRLECQTTNVAFPDPVVM